MPIIPQKYNYVYEAVLDNHKSLIDSSIDSEMASILSSMLSRKKYRLARCGRGLDYDK